MGKLIMDNIIRNKKKYPSIYEAFEKVAEKKSYYDIGVCNIFLWKDNVKDTQINCGIFVKDHYELGRKDECFNFNFQDKYLQEGKHAHTVSLYLMGMAFIEKSPMLRNELKQQLQSFLTYYKNWYSSGDDEYDLLYTWYLTAMYHDVASCIEREDILKDPINEQKELSYWLENLEIQHSPYKTFDKRLKGIPQRFPENLIENYFVYRADSEDARIHKKFLCDHGILAGYLFFDRFIKNFLSYTKNGSINDNGMIENLAQEENRWRDEKRQWNIEQLSHAAYVADAIICHNIWMGGERDTELYQAYGLSPLLYTEHSENKLSIKNYPLQFMLCLLDTIEPIKRFAKDPYGGNMEPKEVLSHVHIGFGNRKLIVQWDKEIEEEKCFQNWKESLEKLKNWMEVRCEAVGKEITISWNTN